MGNAATKILETKKIIMAALYGKSLARVTALASKNVLKRPICTSQKALMADKMTHTGQSWEDNDPRSLRFMDKTKETNEKWAMELIANIPPIVVNTSCRMSRWLQS